jgi:hypothetical protein
LKGRVGEANNIKFKFYCLELTTLDELPIKGERTIMNSYGGFKLDDVFKEEPIPFVIYNNQLRSK